MVLSKVYGFIPIGNQKEQEVLKYQVGCYLFISCFMWNVYFTGNPVEEIIEIFCLFSLALSLYHCFICVVCFQIKHYSGHFEVVSLVGTISDGGHLHTSLSDEDGNVFGGHVIGNMTVYTTAEIMIGECTGAIFSREQDEKTGYKELIVQNKE